MTNYTWRVIGLRDYPAEPGAVYFAMWDLTASGDKEGYISGEVPLVNWLPYNELTTEVMVKWVKDSIGSTQVQAYERNL